MGHIYIAEAKIGKNRFIKIGYTEDISRRFINLRSGCPVAPSLIMSFIASRKIEHELHKNLARFRSNGEWYHYNAEVIQHVEKMKKVAYSTKP